MAYKEIITKSHADSHQSQPWCIAHFMSFAVRDTFYKTDGNVNPSTKMKVNNYTIVSDIINCKVESNKSSQMMTAELLLSSGDFNYQSLISPGDYCGIWMHDDVTYFDGVISQLINLKSSNSVSNNDQNIKFANDKKSGFKFLGRVNSVRSIYKTTGNGIKSLQYMVTLKGFSELQSQVYFNPYLATRAKGRTASESTENQTNIFAEISSSWDKFIANDKGNRKISGVLDFFIDIFLGRGPEAKSKTAFRKNDRSPNEAFLIPSFLPTMLGLKAPQPSKYSDILHTLIGIQKYTKQSYLPDNLTKDSAVQKIGKGEGNELLGNAIQLPDSFNQVTIWSLLQQHSNSALNEMYVTMKLNEDNRIVPTLIIRQIPFTSNFLANKKEKSDVPFTKFFDLPTWSIDPSRSISSYNIGTSDAARFNFFQIYGQYIGFDSEPSLNMQQQISMGNYKIDSLDISRHGTRAFITTTNSSFNTSQSRFDNPKKWVDLISDWYANGHLKLSGNITCSGISEPICIGDNLEFDGNTFHIESVLHFYDNNENKGLKSFITSIGLSNGVRSNDNKYYISNGDFREQIADSVVAPGYNDDELSATNTRIFSTDKVRSGRKGGDEEKSTKNNKAIIKPQIKSNKK